MQWAQFHPILKEELFHVPNGGTRNIIEAARLKQEGVKRGVPDYYLDVPCNGYHGLRIELKRRKGGVVSPEQKEWIERLNRRGYAAFVAKGWEEAAKIILDYFQEPKIESDENYITRKMSYGGTISFDI